MIAPPSPSVLPWRLLHVRYRRVLRLGAPARTGADPGRRRRPRHDPRGRRLVAGGRTKSGWWRGEGGAGPEADYGFLLDDNDVPRPDPRSRRQPEGVHGLSRRFDP